MQVYFHELHLFFEFVAQKYFGLFIWVNFGTTQYNVNHSVHFVLVEKQCECTVYKMYTQTTFLHEQRKAAPATMLETVPRQPGRGHVTPCPSAGWKGLLRQVYPPFPSKKNFLAWSDIGIRHLPVWGQSSMSELLRTVAKISG